MSTTTHSPRPEPIVIVGVDGSKASDKAVDWAARYAANAGRNLALVTAWRFYDVYAAAMTDSSYTLEHEADRALQEARKRVIAPGIKVSTLTAEGHTGKCLVDFAQRDDVLVLGGEGRNTLSPVLGSNSRYCLHHSPCTVVIVR